MRHFFYVHGFGSSPESSKARFLRARLAQHSQTLWCPDLNCPDFSTLTVSRMIAAVTRDIEQLPPAPIVLIGSSLGGLVALHLADRWGMAADPGDARARGWPIDRLVLFAPAVDFAPSHGRRLGDEGLALWRRTDRLEVFHHADMINRPVGFALHLDALQYDSSSTSVTVPILIFHGRGDQVVDPAAVESFADGRDNVTLRMLDDDHQLLKSLDGIWEEVAAFLGIEQA